MSNQRYDDEILSAIIDDEADAETVAAVAADSDAAARLANMRQAVEIVGEEPPPATAERRSASIAAALAAATPAPEVSSLATKRQERVEEEKKRSLPSGWILAVAAAVAFLIAIPIGLVVLGSDSATETATDSISDSASLAERDSATDAAGDAADAVEDVVDGDDEEEAMEDDEEAMEDEEAFEEDEAMEDEEEAMEDEEEIFASADADAAEVPSTTTTVVDLTDRASLFTVNNAEAIDDQIAIGTIRPQFSADQVESAGVSPACLDSGIALVSNTPYALVNLSPFGGADRLVLVEFDADGMSRVLDAEDCSVLG